MKIMACFNNHFTPNVHPLYIKNAKKQNDNLLKERYPNDKISHNPLPIYVISCHGVINFGVNLVQNKYLTYDICNNNEVEPNISGTNYFILNNNTFVLNTSALGTDACVISSFDNMIVEYLIGGKETRKTKINEPNYVTFAREIFSSNSINKWIDLIPCDNINCSYIDIYNNYIQNLCKELFDNIKRYNFRNKIQKYKLKRNLFLVNHKLNVETEKLDKNTIKKIIIKHKKNIAMLNRIKSLIDNSFTYKSKLSKTLSEIMKFNTLFKKYFDNKPIIGCANFPCIEKKLEFYDNTSSTEKERWMMGVVEISKNTEDYMKSNLNIKLTRKKDIISNKSIKDQKNRIINNIDSNLLSGYCKQTTHLTKNEWLTNKINYIIENKNAKSLRLSEITCEFGEGIYIIQNCSPLFIWNCNINRRISKRTCKHLHSFYEVIENYTNKNEKIDPEFEYIENKYEYLNNTSCLISQRSLYKYIYNELQIYFKHV